ncbi:hypothetical protein HAX54_043580 [Datura stramonium]|uniref:Uncharacterized protein n=1 Tax=Datura stramonium TaxID=4076 RepID=A0ABS8SPM5_DATST|nr:hypothetical protein [Datura stramonium]
MKECKLKQVQRHHDTAEEKTIVDKLRSEIQTFLKARQFSDYGSNVLNLKGTKESSLCRHSLESFQLNNPASAPRIEKEDDDSFDNVISASESKRGLSGKHDGISCINQHGEFTSNIHVEERTESNPPQTKSETQVSKDPNVTSSRIQPEEKIFEATVVKETPVEATDSSKTLPNDDKHIEQSFDPTTFTGPASPVQKWTSKVTATDREVIESSSKLPLGVKENTLKAKLLEARLENQQLQPAIKGLSELSASRIATPYKVKNHEGSEFGPFDPRTAVMDPEFSPTRARDPDFGFAFNDSNFSDRLLQIEIMADSLDPQSDSDSFHSQSLADWARTKTT